MGYTFAGIFVEKPGVYSIADTSAMVAPNTAATGIIGAVGPAKAGTPGVVYRFGSPKEAVQTLKSGTLLDCISLMYNPTGNGGGANTVYAIRVVGSGAATASTTLKDGSNNNVLILRAPSVGELGNYLKVMVTDASSSGKKIILRNYYTGEEETFDNLQDVFSIRYTGEETTATLSITVSGGSATTLVISAGADSVTVDLTKPEFNTIGKLILYLNALPNFSVASSPYLISGDLPSAYLDTVSNQDIKTSAYTCTATLGSIIYAVNTYSTLVVAEKASASATNPPANTTGFVGFSGGSDGAAPTASDYEAALALLEAEDCDIIFVASGDAQVQSKVMAHVNSMSSVTGRKERIAVFGLENVNATASDYIARALSFNSPRAVVVAPGIVVNTGGTSVAYPSFYTAAMVCGLLAGLPTIENITFKTLGVNGLTKIFTPSEITQLIQGGVCAVEYAPRKGYRIVRGITTYLAENNLAKREINCVRVIDALSKDLREVLENRFIGRPLSSNIAGLIRSTVVEVLDRYVAKGALVGGEQPPYRNINVEINQDVAVVTFEVSPIVPLNFIFVKQIFTPAYQGNLNLS